MTILERATFRWLHLSDLHFISTPPSQNMQLKLFEKLKKVITLSSPVDCIVITGDFFDKGIYDENMIVFLTDLYQHCNECGNWSWKKGTPMKRLFVCPGNHDLERNVVCYKTDKSDYSYQYRPKVIKTLVEQDSTKDIFLDRDKEKTLYSLMTESTFFQYEKIILGLLPPDRSNGYKHECKVYRLPADITPNPIVFIGINTELYAGQVRESKKILDDIASTRKKILDYESSQNFEEAKRSYERYVQLSYEIRDGNYADDDKKLCFISKKAQEYVKNQIRRITDPIVIMFGHHSLDALTDGARIAEANFAKNFCFQSKIYLCGHSHKLGNRTIETNLVNDAPYKQHQTCVGGAFADSSGYNDFSFSVGEINWYNSGPVAKETLYLWTKNRIDDSYDWILCSPQEVDGLTPSLASAYESGSHIDTEMEKAITEDLQLNPSYSNNIQTKDSSKTIQDPTEKKPSAEKDLDLQKASTLHAPHIPKISF